MRFCFGLAFETSFLEPRCQEYASEIGRLTYGRLRSLLQSKRQLLLKWLRFIDCLLDQGKVQIKPICQARRSLGSSGIWRHDDRFANVHILSDPTEIAGLMTVSHSRIVLHV